jgi:hypothetical protein
MARTTNSLTKALADLPDPQPLPRALPLVHLSVARWFENIADCGYIAPRKCSVFGKDLLYLFYGGVFYRTEQGTTRDPLACPIAFVFSPEALTKIGRLFPFDSGALAAEKYGTWTKKLLPFERFCVDTNGMAEPFQRAVSCIFGSNVDYLDGNYRDDLATQPPPLPTLGEFFTADLTSFDVDQRQMIIECQTEQTLSFKDLLWVGFPESMMLQFVKLCDSITPIVPQYFPYPSHRIKAPAEMAAVLESKAREDVIQRYLAI